MTAPGSTELEVILERLREQGGRASGPRRVIIAELLEARDAHICAEDLARKVNLEHPDIAESTIYRTLAALERLGIVEHVHLGHGPSIYHLCTDTHQHLVCQSCGRVTEVPEAEFAELAQRLDEMYRFRIQPRHFAILGRCRKCQRRSRAMTRSGLGATG